MVARLEDPRQCHLALFPGYYWSRWLMLASFVDDRCYGEDDESDREAEAREVEQDSHRGFERGVGSKVCQL